MGELPKTMKALVAYGLGDYRLELDYPVPECGPDDIIIKTEACGICAGDLKCSRKAARTLSAPNFPVCVPSIRSCRLDGTFLTVCGGKPETVSRFLFAPESFERGVP